MNRFPIKLDYQMPSLVRSLFYFLFVLISAQAFAQRAIPPHGGEWVHDEANVLSASTKAELETILKHHRDSTSNQIAVYLIPSLEGDDIDDYANRVFAEWKLGQEKKDNGVLFLIAMQDKKMRIEVGYGLEGVLTDALSSRINRNEVSPHFRAGDYEGGVKAGVVAIIKSIQGTYVNEDPPTTRRKGKRSPIGSIIIIIIIIALMSRRKGGGGGGGGYWSAAMLGSLLGNSMGRSSGSWGSGSDFGGGGFSGGGGSSDSW